MSATRLEKKLCLAKESPESVFDLSDCNLKCIPNVCTTIKVLRKECLCLQNNQLTNLKNVKNFSDLCLLTTLDLSFNKITELPKEIECLKNLQILLLPNNCLASLPNEIGSLLNLKQLIASSNKLNSLPESIGRLRELQVLDVRKNNLRSLPISLYQNRMLRSLMVDEHGEWESPPKSVIIQGTAKILSYFAQKDGAIDFQTMQHEDVNISVVDDSPERLNAYEKMIGDNLRRLEKEKAKMLLQRMDSERNITDQQEKELMLHERNKNEKQKFLIGIINQQRKIDQEVQMHQKSREQEQKKLIHQLRCVENTSDEVIKQLLETNAEQKKNSMNTLISSMNEEIPPKEDLQSKKVLESMEKLLLEEYVTKTIEKKESYRKNFINNSWITGEYELQSKMETLLSVRHNQRRSLINDVKSDTELQHAALLMLMEKSDHRNMELQNQITLIQNQLLNLTTLELHNNHLRMYVHMNEIAQRRTTLSELLMDIFEQQQAYRKQMIEELREMEHRQARENAQNYWLMQYQRLLNLQPDVTKSVNPSLLYELALYGVSHYASLLAISRENLKSVHDYAQITDSDLERVGIHNYKDRYSILKVISNFVSQHHDFEARPNAPELSELNDHSPSAPSAEELHTRSSTRISLDRELFNECVICIDEQSRVIFLPCGHLCSCTHCSVSLTLCPLCRCDISQKMKIFTG